MSTARSVLLVGGVIAVVSIMAVLALFLFVGVDETIISSPCGYIEMSPDKFRESCEGIEKGEMLIEGVVGLGIVVSNICDGDQCVVVVEGFTGLFCDQCLITYSRSACVVTEVEWLYGDG